MRIRWTEHAKASYSALIDDHIARGKRQKAAQLMDRVDEFLELILRLPLIFPKVYSFQDVRKAILGHNLNLYYQLKQDEIIILLLWPNRSNPDGLEFFLSQLLQSDSDV